MLVEDISKIKNIIKHEYNQDLSHLPIVCLDEKMRNLEVKEFTWLFQIKEFAPGKEEDYFQKISVIMDTLYLTGATCILIVQCNQGKSDFYIGVVNKNDNQRLILMKTILASEIVEHFHGSKLEELDIFQTDKMIKDLSIEHFDTQCITSVTNSAIMQNEKDAEEKMKGMEHLLDSIQEETFTLMIIADPVSKKTIKRLREVYENIASDLSAYESATSMRQISRNSSHTHSVSEGENESKSQSQSKSHNQSQSISDIQGVTVSNGWNTSERDVLSSVLSLVIKDLSSISNVGLTVNESKTTTYSHGQSETKGVALTDSVQTGRSSQEGNSNATGVTITESIQTQRHDYTVKMLHEYIEKCIEWMEKSEDQSIFDCCTYVISSSAAVNARIAGHYQALTQERGDNFSVTAINTWTDPKETEKIRNYLGHFTHPIFELAGIGQVSSASMMKGKEVGRQMMLPQKTVLNLPVTNNVAYGKDIIIQNNIRSGRSVHLGKLSYMGKTYLNREVFLDVNSLSSHTFITATNGSGKSNAVYQLMTELMDKGIKCLVIEPAKGEYKNVFGMRADVKVFGTNMRKTPLLNLNPFFFNDEIEVAEHIDALLDIFNACWPMQAAMPAVLKDALEKAYVNVGWDLEYSVFKGNTKLYPCFADVLEQLYRVIEESDFSTEVKSNYKGALITRVKELCNGIFGKIFVDEELGDETLFGGNTIIDLSRCGRAETRALIMGILVLRLQEYHRKEAGMNQGLKHVTILEEAHHLLRSTSISQGMESANLMGKSVEMIANSIAEMRSYGEGFIIVDQSPGLLDRSVIRNTNTKVILRLPESSDREIVGLSVNLNSEQMSEIARLPRGTAVVYQGNWQEAVLCEIDRANVDEHTVYQHRFVMPERCTTQRDHLLAALLGPFFQKEQKAHKMLSETDILNLIRESPELCRTGLKKRMIMEELENSVRINYKKRAELIYQLLNRDSAWKKWEHYQGTVNRWTRGILEEFGIEQRALYLEEKILLMMCLLYCKGREDERYHGLYQKWLGLMNMEREAEVFRRS